MKFGLIIGGIVAVGITLVILFPRIGTRPGETQATNSPEQVDDRSPQEVARDQEQMVASIMVEDLALRFLVAIREKDDAWLVSHPVADSGGMEGGAP